MELDPKGRERSPNFGSQGGVSSHTYKGGEIHLRFYCCGEERELTQTHLRFSVVRGLDFTGNNPEGSPDHLYVEFLRDGTQGFTYALVNLDHWCGSTTHFRIRGVFPGLDVSTIVAVPSVTISGAGWRTHPDKNGAHHASRTTQERRAP